MAQPEDRWAARPGWARLLRAFVFLVPVTASVVAAWAAARLLPHPHHKGEIVGVLAVLLVVSTAALLMVDRLARRLLPLARLLELTMLFPSRAPSRLSVARDAIRRRPIADQLRRVRESGGEPAVAAREVLALLAALQRHDRPTRGHAERVRIYTDLVAEQMKLPERDRDLLRWAAILHDVGKLLVPAAVLNKPGRPDEHEWAVLRSHPLRGAEVTGPLLPWLGEWGDVIIQHHEKWDGSGYPDGLAGRSIGLGARIVAAADAFDVMTAARAYKRPVSRAAALAELVRCAGTHFDPTVVRAMLSVSAPRLRRAQGIMAWLADVPLLASNTVPPVVLARVVGVGALATTTVATGLASLALVAPPTTGGHRPGLVGQHAQPTASSDPSIVSHPVRTEVPARRDGRSPIAAHPTATGTVSGPQASGTAGTTPSTAGTAPSLAGTAPSLAGVAPPTPTVNLPQPIAGVINGPVGTITGVINDPVGTITGVINDPVGTITGVVADLAGAATHPTAAGGLASSAAAKLPTPPAVPEIPAPPDLGKLLGK